MKTLDFDFELPKSHIAQSPVSPRDNSRLFAYDTAADKISHKRFFDIEQYLNADDLLVVNKSKVFPARIVFDNKEVFLLKNLGGAGFNVLVRPGRFFKLGRVFDLPGGLKAEVIAIREDGTRDLRFNIDDEIDLRDALENIGSIPLPPYIADDQKYYDDYQTVFADESVKKSVAAPTAGLHFTDALIDRLKFKGVLFEKVTLHVGRGTFLPVTTDDLADHIMHDEEFEICEDVVEKLNNTKSGKGRIVAVGTTSVRVLESSCVDGKFLPAKSSTDIFIYPGKYDWKAVDALITNFHLPKSTLIMLVASFLEHKGVMDPVAKVLELYEQAKQNQYRFYSFGDAMFIY